MEDLDRAMQKRSVPAEQPALEDVSLSLHEIYDALLEADGSWDTESTECERVLLLRLGSGAASAQRSF